jgi:hypothetical protein
MTEAKDRLRPDRTGLPEGMTSWLKPIEPDGGEVATTTSDSELGSKRCRRTSFCN